MPQSAENSSESLSSPHHAVPQRLRLLAHLLDEQFRIPGTQYRLGLDALLGLIPGVGDVAGMLLSTYILYEARRLGVPRRLLLRMIANVGIDTCVGAIPLVGDIFDVAWKVNKKNVDLLHTYLASRSQA